jgi:predicted HTH domain antitoxin
MSISIEVPENIVESIRATWGDPARRALESLAIEGYRAGKVSRGQVGEMLGLNFWDAERFLVEHGGPLQYDRSDLAADCQTLRETAQ